LFATPFTNRRAIYGFIDRQDLPGTFRVFDFASPDVSTPMRPQTTVPQQALFGMNSAFVVEQARALTARAEVVQGGDTTARIQALYRLIFSRAADLDELAVGKTFLESPSASEVADPVVWQYGMGEYDESAKQLRRFTPLPHYQEGSWRGGAQLPDPAIGWVNLTAQGGHPGGDRAHTAVRRWTAPQAGIVKVEAALSHAAEPGDGVRGHIISSRSGELGTWTIHHGQLGTNLERVEVVQGETLDFVVDCLTNEAHDSFGWSPVVTLSPSGPDGGKDRRFSALADFFRPGQKPITLSPLDQYAQALLLANEFVFVD
jgi:hypothetical protein